MRDFYTFDKASLTVGAKTPVDVKVSLEVAYKDDDEYGDDDNEDYGPLGVKMMGELQIEVAFCNTLVQKNTTGILSLRQGDDSSRFNVICMEFLHHLQIVPNKIRREFWLFYALGRPISDGLDLFPDFTQKKALRVYTVTNFNGSWPLGVSCVVVANNRKEARRLLDVKLEEAGVLKGRNKDYDLDDLDIFSPAAFVLNDGYH